MGPKKAPGLDGFTAEILKRALLSIRNYLLRLYNGMLSSGRFPTGWKEAQVILIPSYSKEKCLERRVQVDPPYLLDISYSQTW